MRLALTESALLAAGDRCGWRNSRGTGSLNPYLITFQVGLFLAGNEVHRFLEGPVGLLVPDNVSHDFLTVQPSYQLVAYHLLAVVRLSIARTACNHVLALSSLASKSSNVIINIDSRVLL